MRLTNPIEPAPRIRRRDRWTRGELLCFDLETTGTDRFSDVPVSFALLSMRGGRVVERLVRLVDPARPIPGEATAVHGITTERARRNGITLESAVELVVDALVDASRRGIPVVGVKLDFDLTIIDVLCRAADGRGLPERGWTGPVLDALVLDRQIDPRRKGRRTLADLCACYRVQLGAAHHADCDAEAAARVLLAMAKRHRPLARATPNSLHAGQVGYHRDWARSFDAWRRRSGLEPLDPSEECWPIAQAPRREVDVA
ncbi:MAG: exonuclease domain-containing protein [Acidimicrobiales bacterium]